MYINLFSLLKTQIKCSSNIVDINSTKQKTKESKIQMYAAWTKAQGHLQMTPTGAARPCGAIP